MQRDDRKQKYFAQMQRYNQLGRLLPAPGDLDTDDYGSRRGAADPCRDERHAGQNGRLINTAAAVIVCQELQTRFPPVAA